MSALDLEALKAAALATLKRRREAEKGKAKPEKESDLSALRKAALLSAANKKKREEDEDFEEISNTSSEFSLIEDDNDKSEQDASSLVDDGAVPDLLDDIDEFDMDDLITDDKPQEDSPKPKPAPTKPAAEPLVKNKVKSHKDNKPLSEEKTSKLKVKVDEKPKTKEQKTRQKTEQKPEKTALTSQEVKSPKAKPAREVLSPREVKAPRELRSPREVRPPSSVTSKSSQKRTVVDSSSRTSQSSVKRDRSHSPVVRSNRSRSPPPSPEKSYQTSRTRQYSDDRNGEEKSLAKYDQQTVPRKHLKAEDKLPSKSKRNVKERLKSQSHSRSRSPVHHRSSPTRSPTKQTSAHDRLDFRTSDDSRDKPSSKKEMTRKRDLHSRLGAKLTEQEAEDLKREELSPSKKRKFEKSAVSARGRLGTKMTKDLEMNEDLYYGVSSKRLSRKSSVDSNEGRLSSRQRGDSIDDDMSGKKNRSNNNKNNRDTASSRLYRRTSAEDNIYKPGQRKKSTSSESSSKPPLKSKHEQDLDEKIRQIKEKNAALEARQKLIEQEKRMFG